MQHTIIKRLTTVEEVFQYMQSGEVKMGVRNPATQVKFIYSIKESLNGKRFFVNLIAVTGEPGFMGVIYEGKFERTEKSRVSAQAPAFRAFAWLHNKLCQNVLPTEVEVYAVE